MFSDEVRFDDQDDTSLCISGRYAAVLYETGGRGELSVLCAIFEKR